MKRILALKRCGGEDLNLPSRSSGQVVEPFLFNRCFGLPDLHTMAHHTHLRICFIIFAFLFFNFILSMPHFPISVIKSKRPDINKLGST